MFWIEFEDEFLSEWNVECERACQPEGLLE